MLIEQGIYGRNAFSKLVLTSTEALQTLKLRAPPFLERKRVKRKNKTGANPCVKKKKKNRREPLINPVCERRVNVLVCSLPLHRHSYIGFILAFTSSIHNKQLLLALRGRFIINNTQRTVARQRFVIIYSCTLTSTNQ